MNGGDPNGWRRTYVEESARAPEAAVVSWLGRFALAFVIGFLPLYAIAEGIF